MGKRLERNTIRVVLLAAVLASVGVGYLLFGQDQAGGTKSTKSAGRFEIQFATLEVNDRIEYADQFVKRAVFRLECKYIGNDPISWADLRLDLLDDQGQICQTEILRREGYGINFTALFDDLNPSGREGANQIVHSGYTLALECFVATTSFVPQWSGIKLLRESEQARQQYWSDAVRERLAGNRQDIPVPKPVNVIDHVHVSVTKLSGKSR